MIGFESQAEHLVATPSHWRWSRLSRIVQFKNGEDYKKVEVDEPGYPVYGSGGRFRWANDWLHDGPSVLFGRKGTIDRPLYVDGKFWTVDTMFYTVPDESIIHPKFLYYWATRFPFAKYMSNTALPSMTQLDLGNEPLALPPLSEQHGIVDYLEHELAEIDAFIEDQQNLIVLLEERRRVRIIQAVTKGLNPDALLKDSGVNWLGQIPKDWSATKLRYLADINTGSSDTVEATDDGNYKFFVRSQTPERIGHYSYNTEAVLTAGDGAGVGKVFHYFEGKFEAHQRVYVMYNFANVLGRFIYYYMATLFGPVVLAGTAKSTVESLRRPMLANFHIALPPVNEQAEIVQLLDSITRNIDVAITDAQEAISLSNERRAALVSAAVTGQVDVTETRKPVAEVL